MIMCEMKKTMYLKGNRVIDLSFAQRCTLACGWHWWDDHREPRMETVYPLGRMNVNFAVLIFLFCISLCNFWHNASAMLSHD